MATAAEIVGTIQRRVDARLQKEDAADAVVRDLEEASGALQAILKDGLQELIQKGEYKGSPFCRLHIRDEKLAVNYGGVQREAILKLFEVDLGDETFRLAPVVKTESTTLSYSVAGRRGLFVICETRPLRILLAVNEHSARDFSAPDVIQLTAMLLNGR